MTRVGWQTRRWGVGEWLGTLLDQPVEVHAFLLGVFVGVLLAAAAANGHRHLMLTSMAVVLLTTFGLTDTVHCTETFAACRHLQLEPWYFLGGYCLAYLLGVGGIRTNEAEETTGRLTPLARVLAAGTTVAVLAVALYSFVSPEPVHPITGLATVGGFLGSIVSLAAYRWARNDDDPGERYGAALRRVAVAEARDTVFVVCYGTVLGFGYPRLLWDLGSALGRDAFLLGPITWARYGLPSVALYVSTVCIVHLAVVAVRHWRDGQRLGGPQVAAHVFGYLGYALCLFLATGLGATVWDGLLL